MSKPCIIHQVLEGQRDPNDCAIEVLHASCIRMLTLFAIRPSPALAGTLARMMSALAQHDRRFVGGPGIDIYAEAADVWRRIAAAQTCDRAGSDDERRVAKLH